MTTEQKFVKGRLISHFEDRPLENHASGWSSLWDTGDSNLWDRGKPSPALVDIIESHNKPGDLLYPFTSDGERKKVLVPGCGRGYDVVMLALHGFDAYGLEISATAVAEAESYASLEVKEPQSYNFGQGYLAPPKTSFGSFTFVQGDFFTSEWEDGKFDLIYDYTFLCALHPSMRKSWADRMSSLLHFGGLLVCLEFPMYKDPKLPGPPWGLKGVHWNLLVQGRDGLVAEYGHEDSEAGKMEVAKGVFLRELYVKPEKTYEVGEGTDMLSMYRRK